MENNSQSTFFTFAFVIKADTNTIDRVRDFLQEHDVIICYQKLSAGKLFIREGEEKG